MGLGVLAVAFAVQAATPLRAWLDRTTMQLGETVTLNIEADGGNAAQPDFSVLKPDFKLLGTQSSNQIDIVNGNSTSKTLWAIGLEPRRVGHIMIPAIRAGATATAPIQLDVLAAATAAQPAVRGDVFLEVSADPLTPYVQQEVRYTVKLYYAFDLTGGQLDAPQADGLGVKQLGPDKKYSANVNGRQYGVIERNYALTPARSGAINIAPLMFHGTTLDSSDPSGFFSRGRSVSARSDTVHLDVRPQPAQWAGGDAWLPAASLLLQDQSALPNEVHVGDPVTRTIRLQAKGLAFEQLPELTLAAPAGAEIYPDQSTTRTRDDGEWLYGERVRKFAFVPNRAGTLTLPGLTVHWWDTVHDQAESAQLPAKTITVLPAAGSVAAAPPPAAASGATAPGPQHSAAANVSTPLPAAQSGSALRTRMHVWRALALLGFALWLVTLAWWWRRTSHAPATAKTPVAVTVDSSAQRAAFLRACSLGEFAGAERALVAWARSERGDVRNLGELAARLDDAAQRDALVNLQRARYAGGRTQGLATHLQEAFKRGLGWRGSAPPQVPSSVLPALYPSRNEDDRHD